MQPATLAAQQHAVKDGASTTWAHWLATAPDLPYDTTARASSQAKDVKGIVSSALRALLRAKADAVKEKDAKEEAKQGRGDAKQDPTHAFIRLRPVLDHAHLAPTQLVAALGTETMGSVHTHWEDVSYGRTGDRWRAHPAQSENEIENRYYATYVRLLSALADTAAMQPLGTSTLHLATQQPVQYRHYDGSLHTAYADLVPMGADDMGDQFSGTVHEFKHDSAFTPEHIAALDAVHELSIVAVNCEAPAEATSDTRTSTILARPAERDRDKVDFYFSTATGALGAHVGSTLSSALAQLLQPASYAGAGRVRRGSIGGAKRWIATGNEHDGEPFITWAKSIGDPSGLPQQEEEVDEEEENEDEVDPILAPWDTFLADLPPLPPLASHFAFLAGTTFTHLNDAVSPRSQWPSSQDAIDPTPRKDRRAKLYLRQLGEE